MDMTKFEDTDDPGFKAVVGELRRWVKELVRSENARLLELGHGSADERDMNDEARGRTSDQQVLRITQGGSQFGPTAVSGGTLFQGNYVG
jgi:hypothetical protein